MPLNPVPNYPTSLDSLPDPTSATFTDDDGFELDLLLSKLNAIAELLEAKLGTGTSTPTSAGDILFVTGTGSTAYGPRGVPVGAVSDFAGATAPPGWLLCYGQAVSRTTYVALFSVLSTTYGVGDGTTTFNLPDLRGRVIAGKDDMGGSSANRLTSPINGDNLGAAGGSESHTLTTAEMPAHTHAPASGAVFGNAATGALSLGSGVGDLVTLANTGGGGAHNNMQPTIILSKIIFAGV